MVRVGIRVRVSIRATDRTKCRVRVRDMAKCNELKTGLELG